ncbi:hypothetical protein ACLOJK_023271 [Asimina triloba]
MREKIVKSRTKPIRAIKTWQHLDSPLSPSRSSYEPSSSITLHSGQPFSFLFLCNFLPEEDRKGRGKRGRSECNMNHIEFQCRQLQGGRERQGEGGRGRGDVGKGRGREREGRRRRCRD